MPGATELDRNNHSRPLRVWDRLISPQTKFHYILWLSIFLPHIFLTSEDKD
jgi:hypothetical protein